MSITTEQLHAYLDGELGPDDVARVEAALAADAQLARELDAQRRLRDELRAAFAPVLDEPVPARLLAAATAAPKAGATNVADLAARRAVKSGARRFWAPGFGMAAALALGVVLGPRLLPADGDAPIGADEGGRLVAQADLARALQASPGGRGVGAATVGFSFRDGDGRYCRSFTLRQATPMAGVSCREADAWRVDVIAGADASDAELRMASSALPDAVLSVIDARIDGEPLDAEAEAQALRDGWR